MMRLVVKLFVLFLTSFSFSNGFADPGSKKQPAEPISSELKVEIPAELGASQNLLTQNAAPTARPSVFQYLALGLGYSQDHEVILPSSTPQSMGFSSTLTPEFWAELNTRPLLTIGRSSLPAFVLFESNHRVSEANVLVNGRMLADREHLFTQSLGGGLEWRLRLSSGDTGSEIGAAASISRVAAFSTKSLRSETMNYWGHRQDYALRLHQKFPSVDLLVELARAREQLASSTLWLNGVKIGLVKNL